MGYPTDKNGESCSQFHTGRDEDQPSAKPAAPSVPAAVKPQRITTEDERAWALVETWDSLRRSLVEAGLIISLEQLRTMPVSQLIQRIAAAGIRFDFHPTKVLR
jgi:hypothetical protein